MSDQTTGRVAERLPTRAFGYVFTHVPDFVMEDVLRLEREGALYSDHWVDALSDFRHVRIDLTPGECLDYARRSWAYELFLRAGEVSWARDVDGIDEDIAQEADSYSMETIDGQAHCFAAFLGGNLEALSCTASARRTVLELVGKDLVIFTVKNAIDALTPAIRAFNSREASLTPWPIEREDDVRDLLFVMLRSSLLDLGTEEPTPSFSGNHKFVDLASQASRVFIELKWISKRGQWKRILEQVHDDIQCYPQHPACETLFFVIVDTVRDFPDPRKTEREYTQKQEIRGNSVDIHFLIVEP